MPNAASSNAMSHVPVAVSPICMLPIAAVPRLTLTPVKLRPGTAVPSSHTSTAPALMLRCSSSACQPEPGATLLVVTPVALSWNPSLPVDDRNRYPPPAPVGVSRNRSKVGAVPRLMTSNATRAYASLVVETVFFANPVPTPTGLASAAKPPVRTVVDCTVIAAPIDVHCDRFPVSKPSENTTPPAGGVATGTEALSADTLPAASQARTAYW